MIENVMTNGPNLVVFIMGEVKGFIGVDYASWIRNRLAQKFTCGIERMAVIYTLYHLTIEVKNPYVRKKYLISCTGVSISVFISCFLHYYPGHSMHNYMRASQRHVA